MHINLQRLNLVKNKISEIIDKKQLNTDPKIIAVTKTFPLTVVTPLLEAGHIHFGESKIQEAEEKWLKAKSAYKNFKLHMVGKLQTNKAKKAVQLFDYIHSLDNTKLAKKISFYENELNKKTKIFIQVNIGKEDQKSGISLNDIESFYKYCTKELFLNIIGLMCLPPKNINSDSYFQLLKNSAKKLNLADLSMGMSSDYEKAVYNGSTYLRLGEAIFGKRTS